MFPVDNRNAMGMMVLVMTKEQVTEAIAAANAAPFTPKTGAFGGCGRAYVCIGGKDRKLINAVARACAALGLIFQRKAYYGLRNAIYIGYDNADGRALAKSEAFAASLTAAGIPAYSEACSD